MTSTSLAKEATRPAPFEDHHSTKVSKQIQEIHLHDILLEKEV